MSLSQVIVAVLSVFLLLASMNAQQPVSTAPLVAPAWVERSNQDAQVLIKVTARFQP